MSNSDVTFAYASRPIRVTDRVIFCRQSAAMTLTMDPNSPLDYELEVKDMDRTASTNPITIDGNGYSIDGQPTYVIGSDGGAVRLRMNGQSLSVMS